MDSESRPGLGGRPAAAADSEMADLVPEDGQKKADAPGSAEGRGNSSSGTVDGCLPKAKLRLRRVCLDERRFAPAIDLIGAKGDDDDDDDDDDAEANEDGGSSSSRPLKEVYEFWMPVKDGLALPLAGRAGSRVPTCFAQLPPELNLKIFKLLPSIDLARVGCVCSELWYLASDNGLWKQKYVEEFGERMACEGKFRWKLRFGWSWTARKKRSRRPNGIGLPHIRIEGVSVPCCLRNYRR